MEIDARSERKNGSAASYYCNITVVLVTAELEALASILYPVHMQVSRWSIINWREKGR